MLKNFRKVAKVIVANGGTVSFEWPRYCLGWNLELLKEIEEEFSMKRAAFDGCTQGVVSKSGQPILKPWLISTSSPSLFNRMNGSTCMKDHLHAPCAGSETKKRDFTQERWLSTS